ncbi:molecular chaperone [Vibrio hepatarius]|uniref:molecular chaperone n=1 Tax=Vibrio hepatarius TaxID=171383 RepID=UPI001C09FCDA|nr:molecular chaperone [Vibrio hepatarius]MBU2896184.1 molecular chaperone [Vibrio hepatarius]
MITNTITNTLLSGIEQKTPQIDPKSLDAYLATIGKAEKDLEKIEPAITLIDKQQADSEVLAMVAAHQKQVVQSMVSSNPEDAIALALAAGIEVYSKQLEDIQAWTEGGSAVLEPMLDMIYESILAGGVDGTEYEDLMQLLVIDLLMHADEWGLNLPALLGNDYEVYLAQITEHFGSGLHAPYGQYDNHPPKEIINWFLDTLVDSLTPLIGSQIPADSLTGKILTFYNEPSNRTSLNTCADNYWIDPNGFINGSDDLSAEDCERLSPTLKIFILADAAEKGIITAEQWDQLIMGDVHDFEELLGLNDGELGQYLMDIDGWAPSPGASGNGAGDHVETDRYPDFSGSAGIYPDDLIETLEHFPGRELTDEELEEVNRIGDQVKMLQQTLKYWLQICRDEQMAIARNI